MKTGQNFVQDMLCRLRLNNLSYFEVGCNYIYARIHQEDSFDNPINHVRFSQKGTRSTN